MNVTLSFERGAQNMYGSSMNEISTQNLKGALGSYPTGVILLTARALGANRNPVGVVINSFNSVSLDPPIISFCLGTYTRSHADFAAAKTLTLHILSTQQEAIAKHFCQSGMAYDWDGIQYEWDAASDCPVIQGSVARISCTVKNSYHEGDHELFIAQVHDFVRDEKKSSLVYYQRQFHQDCF